MTCSQRDHDELCADLDTFLARTYHVGVQPRMMPDLPVLLHGNCPLCASTLSVAIQEVPGYREKCREEMTTKTSEDAPTAKGTIETAPNRCTECLGFAPRPDPSLDDERISQ